MFLNSLSELDMSLKSFSKIYMLHDSLNLWAFVGENLASRLQFSLFTTSRIYNAISDIGRERTRMVETGNLSCKNARLFLTILMLL